MIWVVLALGAGTIWSLENITDKYSLERLFKNNTLYFLVALEPINVVIAAVLFLLFGVPIAEIPWLLLLLLAAINFLSALCYIQALSRDDVSRVAPLFLMAMIMIPVGEAVFLHNVLSPLQYLGIACVTIGGFFLVYQKEKGLTHSFTVLLLMFLSTLGWSIIWLIADGLVNEIGALSFSTVIILLRFLWLPVITIIYLFYRPMFVRSVARAVVTQYRKPTIVLLMASSVSNIIGIVLFTKSIQLSYSPSLTETISLIQYPVIFLFPLLLTKLIPRHFSESTQKNVLIQKGLSIFVMIVGGLLLLYFHT